MINLDKLAKAFTKGVYDIEDRSRLVIQPKSLLSEFTTVKHGFLFIIRGGARIRVNGTVYELRPGSVFHAAPGMQMDSQVIGPSELEYYSLFYKLDMPEEMNSTTEFDSHFKLEPGANLKIIELLIMLHQNTHPSGEIGKLRIKELFLSLIHQVLIACSDRENDSSPNQRMVDEALAYIKLHYMNSLTLGELAERHAMSINRFSYFFHKYTGLRPIDYVVNYRMERACDFLKAGNFPIHEIAERVGYDNPLYFSRLFKKKFGVSPSAYR
ncbi:AraC family transcriptional regulator [Paenibacillus sp. VTT E-133291]|uniref:helix-turn-helix domain-containing protein n=1 Tax=Paenibacillus sp. VTT E-133291 TaxID=1986223 RepID=UPI000BA0B2E6|nr:AraC family transcriptional regulator [Paenibacillus sp. VTT E-133291]OZQ81556.1 AraC family transcriptional regulator [Paenibacillus sp. VTT E-133291]